MVLQCHKFSLPIRDPCLLAAIPFYKLLISKMESALVLMFYSYLGHQESILHCFQYVSRIWKSISSFEFLHHSPPTCYILHRVDKNNFAWCSLTIKNTQWLLSIVGSKPHQCLPALPFSWDVSLHISLGPWDSFLLPRILFTWWLHSLPLSVESPVVNGYTLRLENSNFTVGMH